MSPWYRHQLFIWTCQSWNVEQSGRVDTLIVTVSPSDRGIYPSRWSSQGMAIICIPRKYYCFDGRNPVEANQLVGSLMSSFTRLFLISGGAGFLPTTVLYRMYIHSTRKSISQNRPHVELFIISRRICRAAVLVLHCGVASKLCNQWDKNTKSSDMT